MTAFWWALAAAGCWGIAPLLEKTGLAGPMDPLLGVCVRSLGVAVGLLALLPFLSLAHGDRLSWRTSLFLAGGGALASIIGQLCFYHALKNGPVSQVVPVAAVYPVLSCVLGVLIFREAVTPGRLAGVALVMGGIFLLR